MKYLLNFEDLKRLSSSYPPLRPFEFSRNQFYVKAWAAKIHSPHRIGCIISDFRPEIFNYAQSIPKKDRSIPLDELEHPSRKDSLWGDLKLLTKKAYRKGTHFAEHETKQYDHSFEKFINLDATLNSAYTGEIGMEVLIRIKASKQVLPLISAITKKDLIALNGEIVQDAGPSLGRLDDYLKRRKRVVYGIIAASIAATFLSLRSIPSNQFPLMQISPKHSANEIAAKEKDANVLLAKDTQAITSFIENSGSNPLSIVQANSSYAQDGSQILRLIVDEAWRANGQERAKSKQLRAICEKWFLSQNPLRKEVLLVEKYPYKRVYADVAGKFEAVDYVTVGSCGRNEAPTIQH